VASRKLPVPANIAATTTTAPTTELRFIYSSSTLFLFHTALNHGGWRIFNALSFDATA
jgi:hypothetical protein